MPVAFTLPMLQDGRLLGAGGGGRRAGRASRSKFRPRAPPGVDYINATWYGILAPAKTPRDVLQVLHDAIADVGNDPGIQAKIRVQGITPVSIGLRDFDAHIRGDMARLEPLLAKLGPSK